MSGRLLIGLDGHELDERGRRWLRHPDVGGVVLFTRNYRDPAQLAELVADIRGATSPRPLVCIDQEGGRVQRLRPGFTALPPLAVLGRLWTEDAGRAEDYAYRHARVMAGEMLAMGIDLSFAPVLDLDRGSGVIGDRAFSSRPDVVTALGRAYLAGMHDAGMKTCGKHFPGHGSVAPDSHTEDVTDDRELADIEASDLVPFTELADHLDAMMIAHVVYPRVDDQPAGYSRRWLRQVLRDTMGYRGVILSDDLGMHAARVAGDLRARVQASIEAGCDGVLVCRVEDVEECLDGSFEAPGDRSSWIAALYGQPALSADELAAAADQGAGEWRHWRDSLERLNTHSQSGA